MHRLPDHTTPEVSLTHALPFHFRCHNVWDPYRTHFPISMDTVMDSLNRNSKHCDDIFLLDTGTIRFVHASLFCVSVVLIGWPLRVWLCMFVAAKLSPFYSSCSPPECLDFRTGITMYHGHSSMNVDRRTTFPRNKINHSTCFNQFLINVAILLSGERMRHVSY